MAYLGSAVTSNAWYPALEANQGFLSLLALVVALSIALHEHCRALNAERTAQERSVKVALDVLNALKVLVNKRFAQEFDTSVPINLYIERAIPVLSVCLSGSQSADTAMVISDAIEVLRNHRNIMDSDPRSMERVQNFSIRLVEVDQRLDQVLKV
jgi:hypothetical protein